MDLELGRLCPVALLPTLFEAAYLDYPLAACAWAQAVFYLHGRRLQYHPLVLFLPASR